MRGRGKGATRSAVVAAAVLVGCSVASSMGSAAEVTRVLSGFDESNRFDFNIALTWVHEQRQSVINREFPAAASTTQARLLRDLVSRQTRDVLNARVEMGVLSDVGVHVDLPYVLRDDRRLDFDRRAGSACVYSLGVDPDRCADESNSTLLRDGILPGAAQDRYGVDARSGGVPFTRPSSTVFAGPRRGGLESLGLGVTWAVMNQARDDSRPTWTLNLDAKLDVGTTMRYDAASPDANAGVGLGYHQVVAATMVSKRLGAWDPHFGVYAMLPLRGGGSPFGALPAGSQPYARPQTRAGAQFGFEYVPWERRRGRQRVTFEARARGDYRWRGASHSELWEPLSGSSACAAARVTACRAGIDLDLDGDGVSDRPHPGVTETQAFGTVGGEAGVHLQAGRFTRFGALFGYSYDLAHFITFATAGSDRDGDGRIDSTNVREANPAYREALDLPGRRFKVEEGHIWNLAIELTSMF